jgi:hypothetical protein
VAQRTPAFPKSYANRPLRAALEVFAATPTRTALDSLITRMRTGGLVVDVTGSTDETGVRVRTVPTTDGELVLPLFTSMAELKLAVPAEQHADIRALILPARDALALIDTADFVAVQFDAGSIAQIVTRSLVA